MSSENKKISIVIPIYNTQKYLKKCLDSVLNNSYKSLEIILVDDCSTDDSFLIIEEYLKKDSRIKCVKHEKNMGLFRSRITGYENSTGEYITFLDSDDYVSCDIYRQLIEKANIHDADIVCCNIKQFIEKSHIQMELSIDLFSDELLYGKDILKAFNDHDGISSRWTSLCNKLFSIEIFKKTYDYISKIDNHIIMAEDLLIDSILFYYANVLCAIPYHGLIYNRNDNSSTRQSNDISKHKKYINDTKLSYEFILDFYNKNDVSSDIISNVQNSKNRTFRYWCKTINELNISDQLRKELFDYALKSFGQSKISTPNKNDDFAYTHVVTCNDNEQIIRRLIMDEKYKCIAFDFFGVLTNHIFLNDNDLTDYIEKNKDMSYYNLFICRKFVKSLFDLAISVNRQVIILGYNVLDLNSHKQILDELGYTGYNNIIFDEQIKDNTLYIKNAKTFSISENQINIPHILDSFYTKRNITSLGLIHTNGAVDFINAENDIKFKHMFKLIANKFEDNPFKAFVPQSFFNANFYNIGYAAVGCYLIGVLDWINSYSGLCSEIEFLDDECDVIKKAYNLFTKNKEKSSNTESKKLLISFNHINSIDNLSNDNIILTVISTNKPISQKNNYQFFYNDTHFINKEFIDFCFSSSEKDCYIERQIKNRIVKGALDFVLEYSKAINYDKDLFNFISLYNNCILNYYLNYSNYVDKKTLEHLELCSEKNNDLSILLNKNIYDNKILYSSEFDKRLETFDKIEEIKNSKIKKAIYLLMTDKNIFIDKLKAFVKRG